MRGAFMFLAALPLLAGCGAQAPVSGGATGADPAEPRLTNIRQLTDGGQNAEAYFSADGKRLIFQATRPGVSACDQIFTMDLESGNVEMVSTGTGRTTCGYFYPTGGKILYSSTHLVDAACPPRPDRSKGYVWPLFDYSIFIADEDGGNLKRLTDAPGYNAEATISQDGSKVIFTSTRDGDLEIYVMDADGSNVQRLTHEEGYDGGAFFSPDGSKIVYRAHHPTDPQELADYRDLLDQGLIRPGQVELFIMDADGSNKRQITDNGAANFAPYFHPSGEKIIFSSNLGDPTGREFNLYLINIDGTGLEQITQHGGFNGFPMFSPDGKRLVFASNRDASAEGDMNVFVADWVETPASVALLKE
jgi:Tol biopolymer transport system component